MPELAKSPQGAKYNPALMEGAVSPMPREGLVLGEDYGSKAKMAEQVRRLVTYVGQEGTESDLEEWVRGLDSEKLAAFAEANKENLPFEIAILMSEGVRKEVEKAIGGTLHLSDTGMRQWAENSRESLGLEKEQVVAQGRDAVMEILMGALNRKKGLSDSEEKAIQNMAKNITSDEVIRNMMSFAIQKPQIAMSLLRNPDFDMKHVLDLVKEVVSRYKEGIQMEESRGILVEVSGHLAKSTEGMVREYVETGDEEMLNELRLIRKIMSDLDEVGGVNLFSAQINSSLKPVKEKLVSNPEKSGKEKIVAENARRAAERKAAAKRSKAKVRKSPQHRELPKKDESGKKKENGKAKKHGKVSKKNYKHKRSK